MSERFITKILSPEFAHKNGLHSVHPAAKQVGSASPFELVHLPAGHVIYDCGQKITSVYFPVTAVVSLMLLMKNGATMEIASVGDEGMIGLPLVMGGSTMPSRAEVRIGGLAYRMKAPDLIRDFGEFPLLRSAILRFAQTLLTQVSQSSACNRHHSVNQQLCRWLLLALDRAKSDHLLITHQAIAHMLGVRREGVTEAIGKLEQAGIVSHSRGRINVLSRARLEAACCECYGIVSREFQELRERSRQLADSDELVERSLYEVRHRPAAAMRHEMVGNA